MPTSVTPSGPTSFTSHPGISRPQLPRFFNPHRVLRSGTGPPSVNPYDSAIGAPNTRPNSASSSSGTSAEPHTAYFTEVTSWRASASVSPSSILYIAGTPVRYVTL